MDKSQKHYADQKKIDAKQYAFHDATKYIYNLQ